MTPHLTYAYGYAGAYRDVVAWPEDRIRVAIHTCIHVAAHDARRHRHDMLEQRFGVMDALADTIIARRCLEWPMWPPGRQCA